MAFKRPGDDYESSFEGDSFVPKRVCNSKQDSIFEKNLHKDRSGLPSKSSLSDLSCVAIGQTLRYYQSALTAYDRHKMLVNQYLLYHPGASNQFQRNTSRDKRDMDVVKEHHKFIWAKNDDVDSWEKKLAKKYYDKLFKEYCICDLTRYTENKVGMRWRTEKEVFDGKGQFICGSKHCQCNESLTSWEMNFAYVEQGTKKNALVKLRLCEECSLKLNFSRKRIPAAKKQRRTRNNDEVSHSHQDEKSAASCSGAEAEYKESNVGQTTDEQMPTDDAESIWKGPAKLPDDKSREDEFEEYLEELLL